MVEGGILTVLIIITYISFLLIGIKLGIFRSTTPTEERFRFSGICGYCADTTKFESNSEISSLEWTLN